MRPSLSLPSTHPTHLGRHQGVPRLAALVVLAVQALAVVAAYDASLEALAVLFQAPALLAVAALVVARAADGTAVGLRQAGGRPARQWAGEGQGISDHRAASRTPILPLPSSRACLQQCGSTVRRQVAHDRRSTQAAHGTHPARDFWPEGVWVALKDCLHR